MPGFTRFPLTASEAMTFPPDLVKKLKLPRYNAFPATLIGRLAREQSLKGQGVGAILLADALQVALETSKTIASVAVLVEAKDEKARQFYSNFGILSFPETVNRLFIPMKTVAESLPSPTPASGHDHNH